MISATIAAGSDQGLRDPEPMRSRDRNVVRGVAALMVLETVSLAVVSALHLSGLVQGRAEPFDPTYAGAAEALIGAVLVAGAVVMLRAPEKARPVGVGVTVFAIAGFLLGLTFTVRGGAVPDIAYHATLLPVFIVSLIVLLGVGRSSRQQTKS